MDRRPAGISVGFAALPSVCARFRPVEADGSRCVAAAASSGGRSRRSGQTLDTKRLLKTQTAELNWRDVVLIAAVSDGRHQRGRGGRSLLWSQSSSASSVGMNSLSLKASCRRAAVRLRATPLLAFKEFQMSSLGLSLVSILSSQ